MTLIKKWQLWLQIQGNVPACFRPNWLKQLFHSDEITCGVALSTVIDRHRIRYHHEATFCVLVCTHLKAHSSWTRTLKSNDLLLANTKNSNSSDWTCLLLHEGLRVRTGKRVTAWDSKCSAITVRYFPMQPNLHLLPLEMSSQTESQKAENSSISDATAGVERLSVDLDLDLVSSVFVLRDDRISSSWWSVTAV